MPIPLSEVQVGDTVYIDGMTSFCNPHLDHVTRIQTKYDEDTGESYKVVYCGAHMYDARNGKALNSPTMYFISHIVEDERECLLPNKS